MSDYSIKHTTIEISQVSGTIIMTAGVHCSFCQEFSFPQLIRNMALQICTWFNWAIMTILPMDWLFWWATFMFVSNCDQELTTLHLWQAHKHLIASSRCQRVWTLIFPVAHWFATHQVCPHLRSLLLVPYSNQYSNSCDQADSSMALSLIKLFLMACSISILPIFSIPE